MALTVSDAVIQEVQQKVADHQAAINLIHNQLDVAEKSFADWQSILAELSIPMPALPAPLPTPVDGLG